MLLQKDYGSQNGMSHFTLFHCFRVTVSSTGEGSTSFPFCSVNDVSDSENGKQENLCCVKTLFVALVPEEIVKRASTSFGNNGVLFLLHKNNCMKKI